jgi:hypothetical protein
MVAIRFYCKSSTAFGNTAKTAFSNPHSAIRIQPQNPKLPGGRQIVCTLEVNNRPEPAEC